MKPALIEDYKNETYKALARSVMSSFMFKHKRLPFVVVMDSSILHFKPWTQIVIDPRVKSAWKTIVEQYYNSEKYRLLNSVVAGDPLLSKYATINFLDTLFEEAERQLKALPKPKGYKWDQRDPIGELVKLLDTQVSGQNEAEEAVKAIVSSLGKEAERVIEDIETAKNFSHFGVPIARLLENPDKFREAARNNIIVHLVRFLHKLRKEAPTLKQAKMPTLVGGRPLGVKKLQRWSELSRVIPLEFLDDDLLSYKIASRTVRVTEQYGSLQNYVVYLDKSGSMADGIKYYASPTRYEYVPKISFAAASALALAYKLKSLGARMTLKLFDTEVHDPVANFAQLIEILMKVRADSGTNISNVLEDALKYRDEKIIVVTDGIDEVSEEAVKKAKGANLDITFVFIQTDNELLRKNFPCVHLKEARPSILLEV